MMQREGADRQHLHVIGKGTAGLWCLYAAALDDRIQSVICADSLLSYRLLTQTDKYLYGADVFIPKVMRYFDLPQVAAAVSPRSLALIDPKDAMKATVNSSKAEEAYGWTRMAYGLTASGKEFRIECGGSEPSSGDGYLRLLETKES